MMTQGYNDIINVAHDMTTQRYDDVRNVAHDQFLAPRPKHKWEGKVYSAELF